MTPQEVIDLVKRQAQIPTAGNYTDQAASDLRRLLTIRCFEAWRFHDWDFSLDAISLSVGPSTYEQTLPATTGEITELAIQGSSGILRRYSRREYFQWQKRPNATDTGNLVGYIPIGRDSSGNLKLRFFAAPAVAATVEGWAKKRFVALTAADITTGAAFLYFPEEMHGILYQMLLADAYAMRNDIRAPETARAARTMLKNLAGEEEAPADADPQSPVPDYIRYTQRNRRSGTRVT